MTTFESIACSVRVGLLFLIKTTSSSAFSLFEVLIFEIVLTLEQLDADRDKGVPAETFDADRDRGVPDSRRTVELELVLVLEQIDVDLDRGVPGSRRTPAALTGVVTPVIVWCTGVRGWLGSGVGKLPESSLVVSC